MRIPLFYTCIYSVVTLFLVFLSYAITDNERTVLLRLHHELELTTIIIDEATQAANPQDRQHIQYPQLQSDLNKILQGIADAIPSERREPQSLSPIDGDYQ
jgi:RAQPRD family integrative conjugative element protein